MNKEELLLKNFAILSKNLVKNASSSRSALAQLIEINPKLGLRCWEECIRDHIDEISVDFGRIDFSSNSVAKVVLHDFEVEICEQNYFVSALEEFTNNKYLLDALYSKAPLTAYFGGKYAISYLIRNGELQQAECILSAIYKNKTFREYGQLWDFIIDRFPDLEHYNPGIRWDVEINVPEALQKFCLEWVERIQDEEERTAAMTYVLQIF